MTKSFHGSRVGARDGFLSVRTGKKSGFTLVELLVVIAIIGLLSTLAVVALNTARARARDSKRVADIKQIQTALELYFSDSGGYPVATAALTLGGASAKSLCNTGFSSAACTGTTYMGLVPAAPTPFDSTACSASTTYSYLAAASSSYAITFCLGSTVGDVGAGTHSAGPSGIQ